MQRCLWGLNSHAPGEQGMCGQVATLLHRVHRKKLGEGDSISAEASHEIREEREQNALEKAGR